MTAKLIDLEQAKAARMAPARFHTIAHIDRRIVIDIQGEFSPAAVRVLANAMLARAAAADLDAAGPLFCQPENIRSSDRNVVTPENQNRNEGTK